MLHHHHDYDDEPFEPEPTGTLEDIEEEILDE